MQIYQQYSLLHTNVVTYEIYLLYVYSCSDPQNSATNYACLCSHLSQSDMLWPPTGAYKCSSTVLDILGTLNLHPTLQKHDLIHYSCPLSTTAISAYGSGHNKCLVFFSLFSPLKYFMRTQSPLKNVQWNTSQMCPHATFRKLILTHVSQNLRSESYFMCTTTTYQTNLFLVNDLYETTCTSFTCVSHQIILGSLISNWKE